MTNRRNDRVSHARYGPGTVIDVNERYTLVEFDDAAVRKFVTTLVQLERSNLPPPATRAPAPRRRRRRLDPVAAPRR